MSRTRFQKAAPILLALLMLPAPAGPQSPAPAPAGPVPFSSGETLHYSISWRLFSAGEARIHIEHPTSAGAPPFWQGTIQATSTGFVSRLYKVDDTLLSHFENGAMCSHSILKTLHEGRRHREIHIDFQKQRKMAVVKETDLAKKQLLRQAENPIPECAYDVVSALFYVRSQPLEVGKTYRVQVNDGAETLSITVEVQAKEEVKTGAGTFRAIRVEPKVFGGTLFRRSGRMLIWFSDDPQRLLVQLKAKLFVGTITAVLEQVERK